MLNACDRTITGVVVAIMRDAVMQFPKLSKKTPKKKAIRINATVHRFSTAVLVLTMSVGLLQQPNDLGRNSDYLLYLQVISLTDYLFYRYLQVISRVTT